MKTKMKVPWTLNKLFLLLLLAAMSATNVNAQHDFDRYKNADGDYDFSTAELYLSTDEIFINYKSEFGLGNDDAMALSFYEKSGLKDSLFPDGNDTMRECLRYKQFYKGYEVENAVFTVQAIEEMVRTIHGKIVPGFSISTSSPITEDVALTTALNHVNATEYAWENESLEELLQVENPTATHYPDGKLMIAQKHGTGMEVSNYAFVWSFDIYSTVPDAMTRVYVDAITGAIFDSFDPSYSWYCEMGSGNTLFNGNRNFQTKSCTFCFNWRLRACLLSNTNSGILTLRRYVNSSGQEAFQDVLDGNNEWDVALPISAHWAGIQSWYYFNGVHGRYGFDNQGLYSLTLKTGFSYNQASYNSAYNDIRIGNSPTTGLPLAALDIIGHEFTHAVGRYSSNLYPYGESGALSESFSDIFGTMIQRYSIGSLDWNFGEDAWLTRNLENPSSILQTDFANVCGGTPHGQPEIYQGANWYTGSCDNGGIHMNNGVQNKWFYLLSQGGTFNNVTVTGIGADKAARIAYKNLTQYLGPNSNYLSARAGALSAATVLYGGASNERNQVANAWAAVGIGPPASGTLSIYPTYFQTTLCQADFNCYNSGEVHKIFSVNNVPGATYTWSIPSGWIATTSGRTATIWYFNNMLPRVISVTATLGSQTATYSHSVVWNPHCQLYGWPCELYRLDENKPVDGLSDNSYLQFYPNPAKNTLRPWFSEGDIGSTLEIKNNLGQNVAEFRVNSTEQSFDISGLRNGVYFVILKSSSSFRTGKLIVKK